MPRTRRHSLWAPMVRQAKRGPCRSGLLLAIFAANTATAPAQAEQSILCQPGATDLVLQFGDNIACRIESETEKDIYRFFASAGEVAVLNFASLQSEPDSAIFSLLDRAANPILYQQGYGTHTLRFTSSDLYSIVVERAFPSSYPAVVDYVMSLERIVPRRETTPFICSGCTRQSRIDPVGDLDVFFIEASAGDVVDISVASSSTLPVDPITVDLIDPDGELVLAGGRQPGEYALARSGTYSLLAHINVADIGVQFGVADYELTVVCLGGPCVLRPLICGVEGQPLGDLRVAGGVPARRAEDRFVFPFQISNAGSASVGDVKLKSPVPQGTVLVGAVASQGTCSQSGGLVSCGLGDLDPGDNVMVHLDLLLPQSLTGRLVVTMNGETVDCDPNPDNDRALIELDLNGLGEFAGESFFPQLVDGIFEGRFQTGFRVVNNSSRAGRAQLQFFSHPDGQPLEIELEGHGKESIFQFDVAAGQSLDLTTSGASGMRVGYAVIGGSEGIEAALIFSLTDLITGVTLTETGVPATTPLTRFTLFVDSIGARDTGLAMVYPPFGVANSAAHVSLRLYDPAYNLIAETALPPLAPGTHIAQFVHQFFSTDPAAAQMAREMRGVLTVVSDQPLMAVTLQQTDEPGRRFPDEVPSLTTLPVIPCTPEQDGCRRSP